MDVIVLLKLRQRRLLSQDVVILFNSNYKVTIQLRSTPLNRASFLLFIYGLRSTASEKKDYKH